MARKATEVVLTKEEQGNLESIMSATTSEQRMVQRASIVLAAARGEATEEIAKRLNIRKGTVSKWRKRYAEYRIKGLRDASRTGPARRYNKETERRILAMLDRNPPLGYARWNGRLLAEALGDVSKDHVWRILRKHGIHLERRRSWCISTDPQFAEKAADIVGLYLNPPDNAVVISVDEKPHIQALERTQGYLKLPNGRALTGHSHEYKRHGTTTLFAGLNILTGQVEVAHHTKRKRRLEFLRFMNDVIRTHDGKEIHVILDNLSTHKPKRDKLLDRHPNVHFHFTPTHASWLNQIECWFSILTRSALRGTSFTSPKEVREAIDRFIEVYNENAVPFVWTKKIVHSVHPKVNYANLRK